MTRPWPHHNGLCACKSLVTGAFPAQKASNAENVIWWRHHDQCAYMWHKFFNTLSAAKFRKISSAGLIIVVRAVKTYSRSWHTLMPRQNCRQFPGDIFKYIFLNEIIWISLKFSLRFVPKRRIDNMATLVQIMAWRRETTHYLNQWWLVMVSLLTHICVTRPQWVNSQTN